MQKLTYINLLNEQIVFCGAPYVLEKIGGLGMADIDVKTLRGAYQQGDSTAAVMRGARTVTVNIHLFGDSREDMYQKRMQMLGILSPQRAFDGTQRAIIIYENDYGRWQTYAIPESGLEASARIMNVQPSMKITFRCERPYWYQTFQHEITFGYTGEGFTFPFSFPISFGRRDFSHEVQNDGQVSAPIELWIEGKGEKPSLLNESTGVRLALDYALPVGSTLYINTDIDSLEATTTNASGERENAFGRLSIETPLCDFVLRPGLNRLRYLTGSQTAKSVLRVRWRPVYEGV